MDVVGFIIRIRHEARSPERQIKIILNSLTPNDLYSGRTAPLISEVAYYIFIQQILVLNILNMVYNLLFFLFKMQFVS